MKQSNGTPIGIVLAAGHGTRMRSGIPKLLHGLLGRPLLEFPLRLLEALGCDRTLVVIGHQGDAVEKAMATERRMALEWVRQDPPRGTGDAVRVALDHLQEHFADESREVVILNGDLPLLTLETVEEMVRTHRKESATLTLLSIELGDPRGYGRLVRDRDGRVERIVEEADAGPEEKAIRDVNAGVYVAELAELRRGLEELVAHAPDNRQGEIYFPPVIDPIRRSGGRVATQALPASRGEELQQVNTRADLARASEILARKHVEALLENGVTVIDPISCHVGVDVEVGMDTIIHPFTVIDAGVRIGEGCSVGPFAHLSEGTVLEDGAQIGNFVETKRTRVGPRSKAKHLSYLGDAELGQGVNIGAGTIFANYDGVKKSRTRIGDGAFVGSGTIFVAPVEMGPGSRTGAGAVVVRGRDVEPGETVVGVPARPLPRAGEAREKEDPGEAERKNVRS